ncbi:MAG: hypothetical protein GXO35_07650 [Gammaproteobacteria bacterium]|nr:hypothetical protein [Gammaproteobacteria bacterium]
MRKLTQKNRTLEQQHDYMWRQRRTTLAQQKMEQKKAYKEFMKETFNWVLSALFIAGWLLFACFNGGYCGT